jgi:hypothetical protein
MAQFDFTGPDGKTYRVTGPDGATPALLRGLLLSQQSRGGPLYAGNQ